jgi:hypothetical protein
MLSSASAARHVRDMTALIFALLDDGVYVVSDGVPYVVDRKRKFIDRISAGQQSFPPTPNLVRPRAPQSTALRYPGLLRFARTSSKADIARRL